MRAIIALDLDGVLNPYSTPMGWATGEIQLPKNPQNMPKSAFVNMAQLGRKITVQIPPVELVQALEALPGDIYWCTTWEHLARDLYAPIAGLPNWPVIPLSNYPARFGYIKNGDAGAWKIEALEEHFPAHPALVTIDDCIYSQQLRRYSGSSLAITPDPDQGLTLTQIASVHAYLESIQ